MAKPNFIELPDCEPMPILYEDRSVLAIDKPNDWMLLPVSWQNTGHNLQAAINSSVEARDFWARSRGLKYLRYVHRLDADTTGVLLFAKSPGALEAFGEMFESRRMEKNYLAVTAVEPRQSEWTCELMLAPDPLRIGRMIVDAREGKSAETHFRVLEKIPGLTLIECKPVTGRTHQIRVHLAESGSPIVSDELYGRATGRLNFGLRAARLAYNDPFTKRCVEINAPVKYFLKEYGFEKRQGGAAARPARPEF